MFKRSIYEAVLITLFVAFIALIVNGLRPGGIRIFSGESPEQGDTVISNDVGVISANDAMAIYKDPSAFFIDSRSLEDFSKGHIKGALSFPDHLFDENFGDFFEKVPLNAKIITYCAGADCIKARTLAEKLSSAGYKYVYYLIDGWGRWQENEMPVETGP